MSYLSLSLLLYSIKYLNVLHLSHQQPGFSLIPPDDMKYYEESGTLMTKGGFNLSSWAAICKAFFDLDKYQNVYDRYNYINISGLRWNINDYRVSFRFNSLSTLPENQIIKREILRRFPKFSTNLECEVLLQGVAKTNIGFI